VFIKAVLIKAVFIEKAVLIEASPARLSRIVGA
jgi:hypothetical protein